MRRLRSLAVVLAAGGLWVVVPGGVAHAHPLGNFTVNHYAHLQLFPDRVELTAVVDRAEIPAAQALQTIAPDGPPSPDELSAAAGSECPDVADSLRLTVDGRTVGWRTGRSALEAVPGAAGLPTLRLTCDFTAQVDLGEDSVVSFEAVYLAERVGWREVTADGEGVRLVDSPVPVVSISDELRDYPDDLLASPLDVRSFTVATEPGENTGTGAAARTGVGDPFSSALVALDRRLEDLVGDRALTPLVGVLAVRARRRSRQRARHAARARESSDGRVPGRAARPYPRRAHRWSHRDGDAHGRRPGPRPGVVAVQRAGRRPGHPLARGRQRHARRGHRRVHAAGRVDRVAAHPGARGQGCRRTTT